MLNHGQKLNTNIFNKIKQMLVSTQAVGLLAVSRLQQIWGWADYHRNQNMAAEHI